MILLSHMIVLYTSLLIIFHTILIFVVGCHYVIFFATYFHDYYCCFHVCFSYWCFFTLYCWLILLPLLSSYIINLPHVATLAPLHTLLLRHRLPDYWYHPLAADYLRHACHYAPLLILRCRCYGDPMLFWCLLPFTTCRCFSILPYYCYWLQCWLLLMVVCYYCYYYFAIITPLILPYWLFSAVLLSDLLRYSWSYTCEQARRGAAAARGAHSGGAFREARQSSGGGAARFAIARRRRKRRWWGAAAQKSARVMLYYEQRACALYARYAARAARCCHVLPRSVMLVSWRWGKRGGVRVMQLFTRPPLSWVETLPLPRRHAAVPHFSLPAFAYFARLPLRCYCRCLAASCHIAAAAAAASAIIAIIANIAPFRRLAVDIPLFITILPVMRKQTRWSDTLFPSSTRCQLFAVARHW